MNNKHLNLTPEIREHWEAVIALIENERPAVEYTVNEKLKFGMRDWLGVIEPSEGCGTVFCIGGAENLIHYIHHINNKNGEILDLGDCSVAADGYKETGKRLGLSSASASALFYPFGLRRSIEGAISFESTKEEAVKALRGILSGDVIYSETLGMWVWKDGPGGDET